MIGYIYGAGAARGNAPLAYLRVGLLPAASSFRFDSMIDLRHIEAADLFVGPNRTR